MLKYFAVTVEYEDERGIVRFTTHSESLEQLQRLVHLYFSDDKTVVAWDIVPIEIPENANA